MNANGKRVSTWRRLFGPDRPEPDLTAAIELAYWYFLGRAPDAGGLENWREQLQQGLPIAQFHELLATSAEAASQFDELDRLSDGEFILLLAEWTRFGVTPREVVFWMSTLAEDRSKRLDLVRLCLLRRVAQSRQPNQDSCDPSECWIMGTKRSFTLTAWHERAAELAREGNPPPREVAPSRPPFQHSGEYVVSAIASLYKGRRYLEAFLENITGQTLFDRSELIIIDADSPEGEREIIADYQTRYPNIIYRRINFRIGVYDAWNIGVGLARGRYLTNTNLDDLRRDDSFQLQAGTLDRHSEVDVVYQDFYYSFDHTLSFEQVARFGFRSELPLVTPHGLLQFNLPHNAPMWRKSLHDKLGLFDGSFVSAGDWEFWFRCLSKGKVFRKIRPAHVAYFQNPEGISTRPETPGLEEGERLVRQYLRKLLSPYLLMSRQAFAEILETSPAWKPGETHYDAVERELTKLGMRSKKQGAAVQL